MSEGLEARREARRRKRQQEEEELMLEKARSLSRDDVKNKVDARLAARRLERQQRRTQSQNLDNTANHDEDAGRRRQERRRLREADQDRSGEAPAEEETSSRRSRRRGTEDDISTEETSTSSRRRQRGGEVEEQKEPEPAAEEDSTPAVEDTSAADEEDRRRQEEEEADAERERQRQQEEERRKRQEEERRQQEERRRRGHTTPRKERQSRAKQRTPRGPLKTPRSARQQNTSGNVSARSITEGNENAHPLTPRHPQPNLTNDIRFKEPEEIRSAYTINETDGTCSVEGHGNPHRNVPTPSQTQMLARLQMEQEKEVQRAELFARSDVKSRIRALEAEKNTKAFYVMDVGQTDEVPTACDASITTEQSQSGVSEEIKDRQSDTDARVSATGQNVPLQSVRSNSDTDIDDRLTDIVANNREKLCHDDTIERFTDFDLGSCSSYDDIFGPKPCRASVVVHNHHAELMSTDEFSPVFLSTENIHERTLVDSSEHLDTTLQASPQLERKSVDPKQEQRQHYKSILKTKSSEENTAEAQSTRIKTKSTQRERDLRRSNSRTRARPAVEIETSSDSSSEYSDHFIPFTVDKEDAVRAGDKRRSSVVERKAEKVMKYQEPKTYVTSHNAGRIESMSENDSLFSGDDVSTHNSVSVITSTDNLSIDSEDILEDNKEDKSLMNPSRHVATCMPKETTPRIIATAVMHTPAMSPKTEMLKVIDKDPGDSDNSLEPITCSGFFGVKSDIPFNAKKKKINARRSGQKISQMTSIWSKMPPTVLSPKQDDDPKDNPQRNISVIKTSDHDKPLPEEVKIILDDESSCRHKQIESRMTELQNQLKDGDSVETQNKFSPKTEKQNQIQVTKQIPQKLECIEESKQNSGKRKEQLDELFVKLNSKLRPKEAADYPECHSSDRYRSKTPMFLAPFDSSVEGIQRSQSQPILTSNEQLEYYDPSQSVREYIPDDAESKLVTGDENEALYETDYQEQRIHSEMYTGNADEQSGENSKSSQSSRSSRKNSSNIAQYSSGSNSPHFESSLSNWSNRSVVSSDNEYANSESPVEEYENQAYPEMEEGSLNVHASERRRRLAKRKCSAFSVASDVTSSSNQENALLHGMDDVSEEPPDEDELMGRKVHTEEWLHEDVGYMTRIKTRSFNASTVSNADSESAISVDSLEDDGAFDADHPDGAHYQYVEVSTGGQTTWMAEECYGDVPMGVGSHVDGDNPAGDLDLKLPLHFLHESSQEEEEFRQYIDNSHQAGEADYLDSHRCIDGMSNEDDLYSSDEYEDDEEDISHHNLEEIEEGEVMVQSNIDYVDGKVMTENMDVVKSMDEMGQDILDYLSDEMSEEGEVEEWEDEECEEIDDHNVDNDGQRVYQYHDEHDDCVDSPENVSDVIRSSILRPGVVNHNHQNGSMNDIVEQQSLGEVTHKGRMSSRSQQFGLDEEEAPVVTDSARVRELFKEHHGHIDDKDIVHKDNIPKGHELPDADEFFLSFEYDEEHRWSVSDYHADFTDDEDEANKPYADDLNDNGRGNEYVNHAAHSPKHQHGYVSNEPMFYEPAKILEPESLDDSRNDPEGSHGISRGIRKMLVAELKLFDPKRLRRTSSDARDESDAFPPPQSNGNQLKTDASPGRQLDHSYEKGQRLSQDFELKQPQLDIIQRSTVVASLQGEPRSSSSEPQGCQMNSYNDIRLASTINPPSSKESTHRLHVMDNSQEENRSERNVMAYLHERRRNSVGEEESRQRSGSMSRERRKSIRSFWQQLDDEKKKKKDMEENWERRREQNRSRDRRFQDRSESPSEGNTQITQKQIPVQSHRADITPAVSVSHNELSMQREKLPSIHDKGTVTELVFPKRETRSTSQSKPPISVKATKKEPPAVAPKPDRARRRSSVEFPTDNTLKPQSVLAEKPKSVKQIAQFHEMQNKALQSINIAHQAAALEKDNILLPRITKSNKDDEGNANKSITTEPAKTFKPDNIITEPVLSERTKMDTNSINKSPSTKFNDIEQMLQRRLQEKKPSPVEGDNPKISKNEIENERFIAKENAEQMSVTEAPMNQNPDVSAVETKVSIQSTQFHVGSRSKTEQSNYHLEQVNLKAHSTRSNVPLFSRDIVLSAPTLEEIDHLSGIEVDDIDSSVRNQSKKAERIEPATKEQDVETTSGVKTQAPRPKFNAKALTKNNEYVMPAFAVKVEKIQPHLGQTLIQTKTVAPNVPNLDLNTSLTASDSESINSLDQISNCNEVSSSRELKSWVADYLKDRISDHNMRKNFDFDPGKAFSDNASIDTSSANSSFYGSLPTQPNYSDRHGSISDGIFSEPALSSRSSKNAKLSVAERISNMKEKMEAAKESVKPPDKLNPTQSQRQFASLLQNRLIDVIAQDSEEEKHEKEMERKKKKQTRPSPNSWAAERHRLFGKGVIKSKMENFNPDQTSTPSTLSRTSTRSLIRVDPDDLPNIPPDTTDARDKSVQDATSRLENLSESLSKDDVVKMSKVRRADSRKYRRVTTSGVPFSDIREKFTVTDSSGSSTESFSIPKEKTRPNSPWISVTGPSPLVLGVINKLASSENTDVESTNSSGNSSKLKLPDAGQSRRGRVMERVNAFSSGENSLSNSRSSSQSRPKEIISGAFDRNLVSELVRRVESSDESGSTSLSSSLSLQPGDFAQRARLESNSNLSKVLQKFNADSFASSNSSPSSSMDRRVQKDRESTAIKNTSTHSHSQIAPGNALDDNSVDRSRDRVQVPSTGLSQALETMSELQRDTSSQHKHYRMDKDRRHTTQVDFQELRDRYNSRRQPKDHSPPQSPALKAIYACSTRDIALDPDPGGSYQVQVAVSSTFQKQGTHNKTKSNEFALSPSAQQTHSKKTDINYSSHKGSLSNDDHTQVEKPIHREVVHQSESITAAVHAQQTNHRNNEGDDEDVFSPLVSARVPEALNLPSDSHPLPAFNFSATNYVDDMSYGDLAESESSDTTDFYPWRDEMKRGGLSLARRHHEPLKSSHQELHHQPIHSHPQLPHNHHPQHPSTSSASNFTSTASLLPMPSSSSSSLSSSTHSRPLLPETIIDARTATGHVRCRILSETPLEPDESGIGASDNSLGSSTISVSSVIQERGVDTPHQSTPPSISVKESTAKPTASAANISDAIHSLVPPTPPRKMSLGNEAFPRPHEMQNLLSPRRASIASVDHSLAFREGSSPATTETHSSNASLSQDSCKAAADNGRASQSRLEQKRRKSKSKFMQGVMDKRRIASDPSDNGRRSSVGPDGNPVRSPNGLDLFGPKVTRKKSDVDDNTMKGYSKRFDALWAKFDPDYIDDTGTHVSAEEEEKEREREEAEREERERMEAEAEEAARQKAEEEEKKKKKGKRKGLGGLTPEKKKLLKKLIMQKAAEDLRNEAKEKAAEKERYINERVAPLKTDGLGQSELQQLVKDLHAKVSTLEEDVYDWEIKIRKQDFEINELTLKVNDTKGKFIKPVLRKVNKTESKLKKIQQIKESTDFRGNLKSTGQNKYALEEDEPDKSINWRDELKPKGQQEGEDDCPAADTEVSAES